MIRSLRQLHRRVMVTLGGVLPLALVLGVAVRKPVASMETLPAGLAVASPRFPAIVWAGTDLFVKSPVQVRLRREEAKAGHFAVELTAAKNFVKPDLLVYWVTGNPTIIDALPADAQLLGVLGSSRIFPLPPSVSAPGGVLVLYSLADNELVEVSKPLELSRP